MINGVKYISKVFTRPRLNASLMREGEEIFHSWNPFIGDTFISNGVKLANGPRSFYRQLSNLGMREQWASNLVSKLETQPNLYTVFSREISQISPEVMKGASYTVFEDIRKMAHNFIEKPELTESLRGYGSLVSSGLGVRTSALIEKGIYDFKTAELLATSMKKRVPEYNLNYYIPDLMQIPETIPSNGFVKVYDNCLKLVDLRYADQMTSSFSKCKFPQDEKELQALVDSLEQLSSRFSQRANYNAQEMDVLISTLREPYQVSFASGLKNMNENLATWRINVKSEGEAKCILDLLQGNKTGIYNVRSYCLQELLKNGCLENAYQQQLAKLLYDSSVMLKGLSSNGVSRFSSLAQRDLLGKIKNETDYNIAKLMIERTFPDGRPVYTTEAIIKVLEQKSEDKLKILKQLEQSSMTNVKRDLKTLGSYKYEYCNNTFSQNYPFQSAIRSYSADLSSQKLLENIKVGEVAQVGEKLVVNTGNELAELKMSKEVFEELFMSGEYISQGLLGDCGFVASIDAIMSMPKGRASVYKLFEQIPGSKDIVITLENTPYKVKFLNGEFQQATYGRGMSPRTPKGLRMLEQSMARAYYPEKCCDKNVITMYSDFKPEADTMDIALEGISPYSVFSKIFRKDTYKAEGLCVYSKNLKETVKNTNASENSVLLFATNSCDELNLIFANIRARHYHNIKKVGPDMSLKVTNPHNASFSTRAPFYELTNPDIMRELIKFELL